MLVFRMTRAHLCKRSRFLGSWRSARRSARCAARVKAEAAGCAGRRREEERTTAAPHAATTPSSQRRQTRTPLLPKPQNTHTAEQHCATWCLIVFTVQMNSRFGLFTTCSFIFTNNSSDNSAQYLKVSIATPYTGTALEDAHITYSYIYIYAIRWSLIWRSYNVNKLRIERTFHNITRNYKRIKVQRVVLQ